jgi:hypothetical protein
MSTCSDCGRMIINTRGAYSLGIPVCQCRPPMSESLRELEDPPQLPLAFD